MNDIQYLASPLSGINSTSKLIDLSYIDTLACLGELSLHCGGIKNTGDLFNLARINGNCSILEIGCGTGATTRALLRAGYNVTVVEPSARMMKTTIRNCLIHTGNAPAHYQCSAENMQAIASESFDAILLECVFGFIKNKTATISELMRLLKPKGVIAVTDFHYIKKPPLELSQQLSIEFGLHEVLFKKDWIEYFSNIPLVAWEDIKMGADGNPWSTETVKLILQDAKLYDGFPAGDHGVKIIAEKLINWERIFSRNRAYMSGHNAVWRKP